MIVFDEVIGEFENEMRARPSQQRRFAIVSGLPGPHHE
jgi:hypothetical protein